MLWRDPFYLWLLPVVAALGVLLFVLLRRRAQALRAFAEAGLVERLAPDVDRRRVGRRTLVRLAVLLLIALALAGPKWGFHWQEVKREGIDLIVAIDTSRSMLATDVKPDRLERAKLAVLDLVPLLQGDRIGLVAFAGTAFLECPLTLDYAAFERSLRAVEVGLIPRGGTALARAIDTSLDAFEARHGKYEALILITDGEDNEGDVKAAAERAAASGVKIFTVGIGTSEGELLPLGANGFVKDRRGQVVKSRLNEESLKEIALTSGGAYVQGLGPSLGLDQVFRDHIATMERREVASTLERRYEERFQVLLLLALLLLVVESAMPARRSPPGARRRWRRALGDARAASLLLLALSPLLVGWLDPPGDRGGEAHRLYATGKFEEAASKYGEGLVDAPESPLLQFNLATALFKQGKYEEAITSFQKVAASGDPAWVARANYNLGNAYFRVASAAETDNPQDAIGGYEQALASYKRSMVADPADGDAKFNHEYVARKLEELKKKLAEQQKEQEQQQEQQPEQQEQQEQQPQEQGQENEQQEQQPQPEEQQEQQQEQAQPQQAPEQGEEQQQQEQAAEPEPEPGEEQAQHEQPQPEPQAAPDEAAAEPQDQQDAQAAGGGVAGEEQPDTPEQRAAHAVLDVARSEELGPEDIARPAGIAGVAEPAQDW
jgi:Ca-activated chloride channel family protein